MKLDFEKNYTILDGAMGTEIQKRGLKLGGIPELLNITAPEMIEEIHLSYMEAGSDIVYANTFGANGYKLKNSGYSVAEIVGKGIEIAKKASDTFFEKTGKRVIVALDLGPRRASQNNPQKTEPWASDTAWRPTSEPGRYRCGR